MPPRIIDPFKMKKVYDAAMHYSIEGFSVLPCRGKRPALSSWKQGQSKRANGHDIQDWQRHGLLENVGIICGCVSENLVVVDLDGLGAVEKFYERFPDWNAKTLTIRTGSGRGEHLYFFVEDMPENLNVRTEDGGFEIRGNGMYVIAPPSVHPDTGNRYEVVHWVDIATVDNLLEISLWFNSLKKKQERKESKNKSSTWKNDNLSIANAEPYSERLAQSLEDKWAQAALCGEIDRVRSAAAGERNTTLNKAAFALGQLVGGNALDQEAVERELFAAADAIGLIADDGERSVRKTISSGLLAGVQQPRSKPETSHKAATSDVSQTKFKPDDDEIVQELESTWKESIAYFHANWHEYDNGYWSKRDIAEVRRKMRLDLRAFRSRGVRVAQSRINSLVSMMEDSLFIPDRVIQDKQRDTGKYINLKNGLYNLETFELEAHRKELMMNFQLDFEYQEAADCKHWHKFLRTSIVTADGQSTDWKMIELLQEAIGYSLTARTDLKASFWLVGQKNSGKSTLIALLRSLTGELQTTIDLNQLASNRFLLADIVGKRLVTFTEAESNVALPDAIYKAMVGGQDEIWVDVKNKPGISFVPVAKVWWAMNEVPKIFDRSGATFERLKPILFNRTIPQSERIPNLPALLEKERAGIFEWAMTGYKRLVRRNEFVHCQQSESWRKQYQHDSDTELCFVEECANINADYSIQAQALYDKYREWCARNGFKPKNINSVAADWKRLGFKRVRRGEGTFYEGLNLKSGVT